LKIAHAIFRTFEEGLIGKTEGLRKAREEWRRSLPTSEDGRRK
jgi:hypothetical protein